MGQLERLYELYKLHQLYQLYQLHYGASLMADPQTIQFHVEQAANRLDQYLARRLPDQSRSHIQKLIRQGQVTITTSERTIRPRRPSESVQAGDVIIVSLPAPEPTELMAEAMPLDVIFEDESLAIINKPAGLVVHPAQGHSQGTLVHALLAHYPDLRALQAIEGEADNRPGIVHRLDRDTSGLMIVARTLEALRDLRRQFKTRTVEKTYLALVFGHPETAEGIIDVPLGRDPRHRQKFAPRADGKAARTHYKQMADFGEYSLLEIGLETGRTHQIRVHLAWLGCPVVGDTVYGRRKNKLGVKRQFLHAWRLRFEHPATGETMAVEAPLAEDLGGVLERLKG